MGKKVPVSERALFARVARALEKDGEILRRCRSDSRWINDLGRYYTVQQSPSNSISRMHLDLEREARELQLLRPSEQLAPV